ncbi:MAG: coproporphyrinogen III oxidase, partial [Alphaproteobacteria bacterium]|nr:coproporphyrinogen III oxidase [Alphaproteobacteria bacterium]
RNVELSLSLDPDRIALFGYAHVPWMKKHQRLMPEAALPDAEARWRQMEIAAEALEARGYVWIGLDHFAKPDDPLALAFKAGTLRRNFQGYTADPCDVLLGFGPSGIGELPKLHVQNLTEIRPWTAAVMEGRLPTARGVAMTEDDKVRKAAIHGLMCRLDIDLGEVALAEGRPEGFFDADLPRLAPFVTDGLIELTGRRLKLTRLGRPLMRTVAATFDAHLKTAEGRHAKAI